MPQPNPSATLALAGRLVRPGGVVACVESHLAALGAGWHSWPPSTAYGRLLEAMLPILSAAGGRVDTGLNSATRSWPADCPSRRSTEHQLVGVDAPAMCRYMADSLRSMRATALRLGLPCPTADEIDGIEAEMLSDAARPGAVFNGPVVVTAWARHA